MKKIAVLLATIFFVMRTTPLWAQETVTHFSLSSRPESPTDTTLALYVNKDQNKIKKLSLVLLKGSPVNVDFPLSDAVKSWDADKVQISSVIWTNYPSAVALMIGDGRNGEAYACAKLTNGVFKAVNLTDLVRGAHLGVLGRPMTDFARSEHAPIQWGEWTAEYGRIIVVRSHFWDKRNQRYTIKSPFLIGNDGEIGGQ